MLNFRQLLLDKGITQADLAEILGISQPLVSNVVRGNRGVPSYYIDKLKAHFGEDVINNYIESKEDITSTPIARTEQAAIVREDEEVEVDLEGLMLDTNTTPKDIAKIIGEDIPSSGKLYPRHIMKLQDRFGDALVDKYTKYRNVMEAEIIESFPIVPEAVTTDPNTNIVKYVEENGSELETINPNQLLTDARVDIAERIKRTSMLPTFQPDDIVFIRLIKDKMKIVDGETYYLDCRNRPTMIRLVKFEPDNKLRLIAKNSQYGDIVIDRCDVINVGVVAALFRMTFGDQYSELEALRREKDAERDRKDSQIDRMLEMMEKRDEQQSKLIDFITKDK